MLNIKTKVLSFGICALGLFWILCFGICNSLFAQDNLEVLKDKYFQEYNYSGFIDYLKDLGKKNPKLEAKISYYIAFSRYNQLKYLEESQNWDEYFSSGNGYRDELVKHAEKATTLTASQDSINLYARTILWQFHKDQQDVFAQDSLKNLMNAVMEYSAQKGDLAPIKYIADKLFSYGNKPESKKLYSIYADKLLKKETKEEELKKAAQEALAQGNVSLSTIIYDAYIERVVNSNPPKKAIPLLSAIAENFIYKDEGSNDPEYAEKIFKKIEELGGRDMLDGKVSYQRAYNLEKARMFTEAQDKYTRLIEAFPKSSHYQEALFKSGMITIYVLKDLERGISLFEKLADRADISPYVISSIYQLGLLSQWKKDFLKAKEYYKKLIELAGERFGDTRELTLERLKELEKDGEIEYNLRTFLDASLRENFDMTKTDLKSHPYAITKEEETHISTNTFLPESGCMSVEVNYLWSGHLGKFKPAINQSEFTTSYLYPGTKEINLVVVTPSGTLDRNFDLVDVE